MPVVGLVSPTHDERKAAKAGRLPHWQPIDELLAEAEQGDPRWSPYPYEVLKAALDNLEERGDSISATALTNPCPRSLVLERKEPYVLNIDEAWRAFRGTMVHRVLEFSARPNAIPETRFFTSLADEEISCKPDLVTADGTIWDYKNTAEVPRYDYPYAGHQEQLQFNRYIVQNATHWEREGEPVDLPFDPRHLTFTHLAIVYLDLNGPKPLETLHSVDVPKRTGSGTKKAKMPFIWDDELVLFGWKSYDGQEIPGMVERIKGLRRAFELYPAWPAGLEELWGGPAGWECPGFPWCPLKGKCLASRYPEGLTW